MKKALVVLAVICLGMIAVDLAAGATMTYVPIKDSGIDSDYTGSGYGGEHTNRGADGTIRVDKKHGEYGIYEFDRPAITAWISSQLGDSSMATLQTAINAGRIQVSFSLVCASSFASPPTVDMDPNNSAVQITDIWSSDIWAEGDGHATDDGNGGDKQWNWTGAFTGTTAVTRAAPNDFLGCVYDPTGGGAWHGRFPSGVMAGSTQELQNIGGLANSTDLNNWTTNVRNSVPLDDSLWAEYLYGVSNNNTSTAAYVTDGLRAWGYLGIDNNMKAYTREDVASHQPNLTITISGGTHFIHPHAGDANNDGAVDVIDLGVLATNYDKTGLPTSATDPFGAGSWKLADFNNDGNVDVIDLGVLATNYDWIGAPATSAVPEPITLSLLAAGALALIRRRR